DDALAAPHALWEYHHAESKKLGRYAQPVIASRTFASLSVNSAAKQSPRSVAEIASSHPALRSEPLLAMTTPDFIDATQRAQAFGLQVAIEHMRRHKPRTAGVAVWQFNDCWPSISWSVVDYYGAPKRAYAELKRLYSPVFASFNYELIARRAGDMVEGDLWLINDLRSSFQNAELCASLNGKEIFKRRVNVDPDSVARVDALSMTLGEGENILRLKVCWGPVTLSEHAYDLNFCDIGEINPLGALLVAVGKRLTR
ncbi:MAG: hypothetical protein KGJ80_13340, partial [Chloroflexota bacterium]|nr:hypothetical protein [Chloroflexota bacterium]